MTGPRPKRRPLETTPLDSLSELRFQAWAHRNKITDVDHPDSHYDYRGYFQATGGAPHAEGTHFPDTFKQHGHPTFSVESQYSHGPMDGGRWNGDTFVPAPDAAKHAQLLKQNSELTNEARQENWSPRTRALGFALSLARNFNLGGMVEHLAKSYGSEPNAKPDWERASGDPMTQTPPSPQEIKSFYGGHYDRLARAVERRDPELLGTVAGLVAPMGPGIAKKLGELGEAGRVALAPKPFLPEDYTPLVPDEMHSPTYIRRGGSEARSLDPGSPEPIMTAKQAPEKPLPEKYAILTAENPGGAPADPMANARAMDMLNVRLKIMGKAGIPTKGAYMDAGNLLHENGVMVPNMSAAEAKQVAQSFGQNSVITHEGFHDLTTGKTTPIANVEHGVPAEAPYTELPGGRRFRMSFKQAPPPLSDVVSSYRQQAGLTHEPLPPVKAVDAEAGARMAKTYEGLKNDPQNPEVRAAYGQLMTEIKAQAQTLKDAGYSWEYVDKDPYKNSAEMLKDLRENHHIKVLKTAESQGHPLLSNEDNNLFRAVHDIWGHGVEENPFGPKGEENAFRQHAASLSPVAQRALATETRGQNSWFNYGPHQNKPIAARPFAEQKAALWPTEQLGDYSSFPQAEGIASPAVLRRGKVFTGANHGDAYTPAEATIHTQDRDGFLTTTGRYVSRHEAGQLADATGQRQLAPAETPYRTMISEDLRPAPARSSLIAPSIQMSSADWNDIFKYGKFDPAEGAPGIASLSKTLPPIERGSILTPARAGSVIGNVPQEAPWVAPEPAKFKRFAAIKEQIEQALRHPLVQEDMERGVGMGFHDWYNTDAIMQSAIDHLGPEQGRAAFNKLMDYMGPTSISSSPEPNLRLAGYQYYRGLNPGAPQWAPGFRPLYPGLVNSKLAELEQMGALNPGQAPKLSRFTGALQGNWAGLAGDRHFWRALRSYGFEGAEKGGVAYGPAESVLGDVMQNAADEGSLPVPDNRSPTAAGQAAIWGGAGERTGVRNIADAPPTFSDIFENAVHRTAHYTGMPHGDVLRSFWTGGMPLF